MLKSWLGQLAAAAPGSQPTPEAPSAFYPGAPSACYIQHRCALWCCVRAPLWLIVAATALLAFPLLLPTLRTALFHLLGAVALEVPVLLALVALIGA